MEWTSYKILLQSLFLKFVCADLCWPSKELLEVWSSRNELRLSQTTVPCSPNDDGKNEGEIDVELDAEHPSNHTDSDGDLETSLSASRRARFS